MGKTIIDITSYCNLECVFCYQNQDDELNLEEVEKIVDSSQSNHINIGGGEPFLHEELVDIVKMIIKKDKTAQIATNGTVVRDDFMKLGDDARKDVTVQVSLHGGNPELYEKITGHDKFAVVMDNIKRFKEAYRTILSSAIYKENFGNVSEILGISYELDLPIRVDLVFPTQKFDKELLNASKVRELKNILFNERLTRRGMVDSPLTHSNACPVLEKVYGLQKQGKCQAEVNQRLYVDPKGVEHKCEFLLGG